MEFGTLLRRPTTYLLAIEKIIDCGLFSSSFIPFLYSCPVNSSLRAPVILTNTGKSPSGDGTWTSGSNPRTTAWPPESTRMDAEDAENASSLNFLEEGGAE